MSVRTAVREMRRHLSDYLGKVHYGGETVIIERFGKPMVAMIPIDQYERLVAERELRFDALEQLRQRLPDVASDEVEHDVSQAIAALRTEKRDAAE